MLSRLFSFMADPAKAELPEPDEKIALGALMVRVAKSDHDYKFEEISAIDRMLARIFGLNPVEAAKLRATCEKVEAHAPSTEEFADIVRRNVANDHRIIAHEALWQIMLADGESRDEEMEIVLRSREMLGLSDEECAAARARVTGAPA
ncbi:TerB family tellurite resistance protein [Roseovarius sp. SCSIO 43702]|uniref:tellurite resistance TerB family protein n=1 Tax=Roseovarius sp. SCSIO 43702 TaxID=2823043 RepID=UPI001C73A357|nr:TerB family tellurite resistance protein [Roseovarius sp. SCSIO 43702]QYX55861.1 TerB family tellurite resistance protein [Roseovarius sp. SCSIO 43702]